jgi:hypothetical protein
MVRTIVHTCKDCSKEYASYQSLCNHRTIKHKVNNDTLNVSLGYHKGINSVDLDIIDTSILSATPPKIYNCKYCNNEYKYKSNKYRHEKSCNKKNDILSSQNIDINNSINKENIIIENKTNINNGVINNGVINKGVINNNNTIILNNFDQTNIEYISDAFMKRVLTRLTKTDDDNLKKGIPHLVENINFNPNYKENNNAHITNMKSKIAKKYINNKWNYVKKDDILKEMHNKAVSILQNWVDTKKDELTKTLMDGLKDYNRVSPEYKKKIIHDEINMIGYNYYKNNIENELDC